MFRKKSFAIMIVAFILAGCSSESSAPVTSSVEQIMISIPDDKSTSANVSISSAETSSETQSLAIETSVTNPVETAPVITDPVVTDPVVTDPVVTDPVVTDPVVTEPAPSETQPAETTQTVLPPSEYTGVFAEIAAQKTLPVVYITTNDGQPVTSKDSYSPSTVTVFNCAANYELTATAGVRIRGNSTATMAGNPPYRIKFDTKQGMLGLHGGKAYKSWVLLRTWGTLISDYTAFKLAGTIFEGKYYSTDAMLVNVYVNNQHMGVYLLAEQNQVNGGRIEVSEPKDNDTSLLTGYCLELDNYPSEEHPCFLFDYCGFTVTDIAGVTRRLKKNYYTVKSNLYSEEQLAFINKYLYNCFAIVYYAATENQAYIFDANYDLVAAPNMTPQEAVCAIIDVNSVANMLILEELTHDYDIGNGSFFISVDFTGGSRYTKLTFDAPWDFNWAYNGSTEGYYASTFQLNPYGADNSLNWFVVMMKMDWFRQVVADKWRSMEARQALESTVAGIRAELPIYACDTTAAGSADSILRYVEGRIAWLNSVWG